MLSLRGQYLGKSPKAELPTYCTEMYTKY